MLIALCENENTDGKTYDKEEEMSKSKKFLSIIRTDKKLLGMFSGIVINFTVLMAILACAFVWYLP